MILKLNEENVKLLTEISNNAIETMIKNAYPDLAYYFNRTVHDVYLMNLSYFIPDDDVKRYGSAKLKDYLRLKILTIFQINRNNGPKQFLKGIVRVCCSKEIDIFNSYTDYSKNVFNIRERNNNLDDFKKIIDFLCVNNMSLDENLNGLGFSELKQLTKKEILRHNMSVWVRNKKDALKGVETGSYSVKYIPSYSVASEYGKYTSWCVTQGQSHFNSYTNNGSQFYFCLKNGFENVPQQVGENCPLDEYGLSMVSVCVKPNGEAGFVTTRWNHANNGENNPQLRTLEQVEEVLGISKTVFTQYSGRPDIEFDDIEHLLEIEELDMEDIFSKVTPTKVDGCYIVSMDDKYNVVRNKKLVSDEWYDYISNDFGEYFLAQRSSRSTILNPDGTKRFKRYFDKISYFDGTVGVVRDQSRGGWFFMIDSYGSPLNNINYDYFVEGIPNRFYMLLDEYNDEVDLRWRALVDNEGNILSPGRFISVSTNSYDEDFIQTESGECYALKPNSLELRDITVKERVNNIMYEHESFYFPYVEVSVHTEMFRDSKFLFFDTDREEIVAKDIDSYQMIYYLEELEQYIEVEKDGKYGFISEFYSSPEHNEWFDKIFLIKPIERMADGLIGCVKDNKILIYNACGDKQTKNGYDKVSTEYNEVIEGYKVNLGKRINFINGDGELIFKEWVTDVTGQYIETQQYGKLFVVEKNGRYNLFGDGGTPISIEWFDDIKIENDKVDVIFSGEEYEFNIEEGTITNLETDEEIDVSNF